MVRGRLPGTRYGFDNLPLAHQQGTLDRILEGLRSLNIYHEAVVRYGETSGPRLALLFQPIAFPR